MVVVSAISTKTIRQWQRLIRHSNPRQVAKLRRQHECSIFIGLLAMVGIMIVLCVLSIVAVNSSDQLPAGANQSFWFDGVGFPHTIHNHRNPARLETLNPFVREKLAKLQAHVNWIVDSQLHLPFEQQWRTTRYQLQTKLATIRLTDFFRDFTFAANRPALSPLPRRTHTKLSAFKCRPFVKNKNSSWNLSLVEIASTLDNLSRSMIDGHWRPTNCSPIAKVAVVIPFRDRQTHLRHLLAVLIPILQQQQLDFQIFVSEQHGNELFNKPILMNAAFIEAHMLNAKRPVYESTAGVRSMSDMLTLSYFAYGFDCVIFHDVDLLPERVDNFYSCQTDNSVKHMSVSINEHHYQLLYQELVGGVLSMSTMAFYKTNGYSNLYYGWGAEDDDMAIRINASGLTITRPTPEVGRYSMIQHVKRKSYRPLATQQLLRTAKRRYLVDGLNSVKYRLLAVNVTALYTHFLIDVGAMPEWI